MSSTDNLTITKDTPLIECPHKLLELVDNMKIKDGESKLLKESLQVLHTRVTENEEKKSGWGQTYQVTYLKADYQFYEDEEDDQDPAHLHIVYKPHTQFMKFNIRSFRRRLWGGKWEKIQNFSAKEVCEWVKSRPAHFLTMSTDNDNYCGSFLDERELHYESWDTTTRTNRYLENSVALQNVINDVSNRNCYVHFNVNLFIVNIEPAEAEKFD